MNTYKIIDQDTWKRATHCAVFRNCVEPAFCVTLDLDITAFYRKIKQSMRLQERYYLPFRHSLKLRRGKESLKNGRNKNDN